MNFLTMTVRPYVVFIMAACSLFSSSSILGALQKAARTAEIHPLVPIAKRDYTTKIAKWMRLTPEFDRRWEKEQKSSKAKWEEQADMYHFSTHKDTKNRDREIVAISRLRQRNMEKMRAFDAQLTRDMSSPSKLDPSTPQTASPYPIRFAMSTLEHVVCDKEGIPTKFIHSNGEESPSLLWTVSTRSSTYNSGFEEARQLRRVAELLPLDDDFSMFELGQELKGMGADSADILNKYLADNGFTIRLSPLPAGGLGAVSIMKLKWQWDPYDRARADTLPVAAKNYPAVTMNAQFYGDLSSPVIRLSTKGGDRKVKDESGEQRSREVIDHIWLCYADCPREGFNLLSHINQRKAQIDERGGEPCIVTFPMVYIHDQPDISWLKGMMAFPTQKEITQAKAENFFGMDENGGFAESAVALGMLTGCTGFSRHMNHIKITKPFFVWVDREIPVNSTDIRKVQQPMFAAYAPETCWQRPSRRR